MPPLLCVLPLLAAWTRKDFQELRGLRAHQRGTSFWYGTGTLVALSQAKVVARVDTLEVCRVDHARSNATSMTILCRKLFVYRDPVTGDVLEQGKGGGLAIVATPSQEVTTTLREDGRGGGALLVVARSPSARTPLKALSSDGGICGERGSRYVEMTIALPRGDQQQSARRESLVGLRVRAPLGLTFQTGGTPSPNAGVQRAARDVESYHYWREPLTRRRKRAYLRVGAGPAWSSGGPHLLQLRSTQYGAVHVLPPWLRALIREELPDWRKAPTAVEPDAAPAGEAAIAGQRESTRP